MQRHVVVPSALLTYRNVLLTGISYDVLTIVNWVNLSVLNLFLALDSIQSALPDLVVDIPEGHALLLNGVSALNPVLHILPRVVAIVLLHNELGCNLVAVAPGVSWGQVGSPLGVGDGGQIHSQLFPVALPVHLVADVV